MAAEACRLGDIVQHTADNALFSLGVDGNNPTNAPELRNKHLPHGDDSATIREKPDVWLRRHIRLVNERLICGALDRDCVPNAEYSETGQLIPALRLQQIWVWVDVMKWSKKSVAGGFDDPAECKTFREELAVLQQQRYVNIPSHAALLKIFSLKTE